MTDLNVRQWRRQELLGKECLFSRCVDSVVISRREGPTSHSLPSQIVLIICRVRSGLSWIKKNLQVFSFGSSPVQLDKWSSQIE